MTPIRSRRPDAAARAVYRFIIATPGPAALFGTGVLLVAISAISGLMLTHPKGQARPPAAQAIVGERGAGTTSAAGDNRAPTITTTSSATFDASVPHPESFVPPQPAIRSSTDSRVNGPRGSSTGGPLELTGGGSDLAGENAPLPIENPVLSVVLGLALLLLLTAVATTRYRHAQRSTRPAQA